MTPNDKADVEALTASQELQSHIGKNQGVVRTSLEQSLILMDKYNLKPKWVIKRLGASRRNLMNRQFNPYNGAVGDRLEI